MRAQWWMGACAAFGCGRLHFADLSTGGTTDGNGSDGTGTSGDVADLGDALSTVGACTTVVVTDTFASGGLPTGWVPSIDPDIGLAEVSSRLVFSFASPARSGALTSITSPIFDVAGRCVTLTVPVTRGVSNAFTALEVGTAQARMRIEVLGTTIGGVDQPPSTFPPTYTYDPVADLKWRIQMGGGRVIALTLDASDRPHQLLMDLPTFFDESAASIQMFSSVTTGTVSGGTAEMDEISY